MIDEKVKKITLPQLKKIEEQVLVIMQMIEDKEYCIDVINQIAVTEKALDGIIKIIMKRHFESCVTNSIKKGMGQIKIDELIAAVFKHSKKYKQTPISP